MTRAGSEHVCVVNGKHLNIEAVTKDTEPGNLIYGEKTTSLPPFDVFYNFYTIEPLSEDKSKLLGESYWVAKSPLKKIMIALLVKRAFKKSFNKSLDDLETLVSNGIN